MATHYFCRSGLLELSAACVLTVALAACATSTANGADTWKEEVLLNDGQKIIVERSQTYKGRSEPGQSAPIGEDNAFVVITLTGLRQRSAMALRRLACEV